MSEATELKIRISENELEAYLWLPIPQDESGYTVNGLVQKLNERKIKQGIQMDTLKDMLEEKRYEREVCVAKGIAPIDGIDGYYEYHFNMDLNNRPKIRDDGSVDYWSVHAVELVTVGQTIATYHDPVDGTDGISVTGRPILAKRGRPAPPLNGKGFSKASDEHTYVADLTGKIEYKNDRVQISSIYEISGDVNMSTGNIDFRGDVVVHGNVVAGMLIKATGTVTVDGICEACTIEAGKDILLRGGVLGGHKARIISKGDIRANFFEYCYVEAQGIISAHSALSSTLNSNSQIFLEGKHADIVGGETYAVGGIEADTLGNMNEVKTTIQVGVSTELLRRVIELQKKLDESKKFLAKLNEGLTQFELLAKEKGIDISRDERRIALLRSKMEKQAEIATDTKELDQLNELVEKSKGATIKVFRKVNPGVTVWINQSKLHITEEQNPVEFILRDGRVVMLSLMSVVR